MVTDEEIAGRVKAAVIQLNTALEEASKAKLCVELDYNIVQFFTDHAPCRWYFVRVERRTLVRPS